MSVESYRIAIEQHVLDDLKARLANTRWPDEVEGAGWDYGTDLDYLKELVAYWADGFDWRAREADLNRYAHYRADLDGFGLHFIHERGRGERPLPLLLTHGWPDSIVRMLDVIPLLTDPAAHGGDAADAFDVVVPSLPGFGFSDRPRERGFTVANVAALFARLMTDELGYERFGAHGGDWGSSVTERIALDHGDLVVGIHMTDIPYWHLLSVPPGELTEAEQKYLEAGKAWQMSEGGYAIEQATKPQTLAYGLNDSPAGLAAWIVEKFRTWSDCGGDVESRFTKDELLTNVTIYWATQTAGSAARYYYEVLHTPPADATAKVTVPTGVAIFPTDLVVAPREYGERFFDIQRWTEMPRGGHFAAMEEPELLVDEIRAFFRPYRGAA
jgi:pimeloyl-ACP methyl ester carboxylesterase